MKYKETRLDSDIEKLTQFKELHKTHQKHDPNLYFVYVLRLLESKKKIDCIKDKANKVEEEIKNDCKNKGIKPILKFLFLEN